MHVKNSPFQSHTFTVGKLRNFTLTSNSLQNIPQNQITYSIMSIDFTKKNSSEMKLIFPHCASVVQVCNLLHFHSNQRSEESACDV